MRAHPIKWDNKILKNPVLNTVTAPPALFEKEDTHIYVDLAYFTRRIQANSKMTNKNKFISINKTQSLQFSIKIEEIDKNLSPEDLKRKSEHAQRPRDRGTVTRYYYITVN